MLSHQHKSQPCWNQIFYKKKGEMIMETMRLVRIGGRVKAAGMGLDYLSMRGDAVEFEKRLASLRKYPSQDLLEMFFPSNEGRLKQLMQGTGFYRPALKTDQGMAGNFLPFWIDSKKEHTDLSPKTLIREELVAVPEVWFPHNPEMVQHVQKLFYQGDFESVYRALETLGVRTAEKGRTPFFFIRPAMTDRPIVFGSDLIVHIEQAVQRIVKEIVYEAAELEKRTTGFSKPANILYCQPDIYILRNGEIVVEKINVPDVGLFLRSISHPHAEILPRIQGMMAAVEEEVYDAIKIIISSDMLVLLTRCGVLEQKEDLLEIMEMEKLAEGLDRRGMRTEIRSIQEVSKISVGSSVLLMNLDYADTRGTEELFRRHINGEIVCFPNPFVQLVCRQKTGLKTHLVSEHHKEKFLRLIEGAPKWEEGQKNLREQLERKLSASGIKPDTLILHADIGQETVPILRHALHSWRQLAKRARRYNGNEEIRLIEIAANPDLLLISSRTGPRLHVFRFMFVAT
jgi:hypothetical protein